MSTIENWKNKVNKLKTDTYAIYLASKDPRVPWYTKALIVFIVAHTFSPIDLIPDFIPFFGYLDDLIISSLGIVIALKLIPQDVLVDCREEAQKLIGQDQPTSWWAGIIVVAIWLLVLLLIVATIARTIKN